MPPIDDFRCNECGFALPSGWGTIFYVVSDEGDRIKCLHPGEHHFVEQELGLNAPIDLILERTGFFSNCVCLDCLHQFKADLGESGYHPYWRGFNANNKSYPFKDKRQCRKCGSSNVKTELEMVGQICPKCKHGIIRQIYTGCIT